MRIKLFSNYLPLLCLTACVWVSCSQNREKKSGKKDHTPVMRLTTTTIEVPQSYVADVQAVQFVEVKPKVEGFVEDVLVDEGEHVKKGQVLGIIEAMKLMNEIESEFDGVVTKILVENEQTVEYGQPLFEVE